MLPEHRPEPGTQPPDRCDAYRSSLLRSPNEPLLRIAPGPAENSGPHFLSLRPTEHDADLTAQGNAAPLGQRIAVCGGVSDEGGRPVADSLIEIWQANAAGRYHHARDGGHAPLDPNFIGAGRTRTDADGRYRFITIRPGAYPWANHANAWRPAHIHFSLFGASYATRLVTQMYFPGDELLPFDPIFHSITDARARELLIAHFDWDQTLPGQWLGFRFDIVLRGRHATPFESATPFETAAHP
jgi:protocatechuate 3,4-dioxygenase, beta subunit